MNIILRAISIIAISIIVTFFLFSGCEKGGSDDDSNSDPSEDRTLAERFPVDGVIDFSALSGVNLKEVEFIDIVSLVPHHTSTLKWALVNDDKELYIAIEWTDDDHNSEYSLASGMVDNDFIQIMIDNNYNGTYENDEDKKHLISASVSSLYGDSNKLGVDDEIGDGVGCLKYHETAQKYQAEYIVPLESDINNQDAVITSATRYNISLADHYEPADATGYFTMLIFEDTNTSEWPTVPLVDVEPIERLTIPDDLLGLVIFTSNHEHSNGEIYSFNPGTRAVTRITNNDMYEGTISLSHNRDMIAFLGAPEKIENASDEDIKKSEIYVINIDGTGLAKLTDNEYLDGHPAWSPDDTKIVYGCYSPLYFGAHIMMMNKDGSGKVDVTYQSEPKARDDVYWIDEMDPEFLPDGRIVFKTNRDFAYTTFREHEYLYIAVMNTAGGNYQRISATYNVVDHDPIGNLTDSLFERLPADENYLELPGALLPWQIVEAKLDGSGETIIVNDVFVNWLPVYDPSGQYVVYFRACGYTEARLMTRQGRDLGRFIPNITKLDYLDWK
ncbi:hypothetical protein ACFL27_12955 [candidate division CSSED10-310 bacterium]|uniref:Carbohydrate-binding domain-containing protein n=1 Tax=candidate division CSSED10-310 bacterium TaxID=2855610 RepID=A0ABV6YY16_UNCC1